MELNQKPKVERSQGSGPQTHLDQGKQTRRVVGEGPVAPGPIYPSE